MNLRLRHQGNRHVADPTGPIDDANTVDYIVVGAGSAGCALAGRLSEDGLRRVLLVEAGIDDPWIWIRIPSGIARIMVGERALWRFDTEPSPGVNGRALFLPSGKTVGGTANINGMLWVRGDAGEYDHWAALGNAGWGYADLLPVFKRMECFATGDPAVRGRDGPLVITEYGPRDSLTDAFLKACATAGIPENPDTNSGQCSGGGMLQLSTRRGLRWSVREAYIRPAQKRPNFRIVTAAQVTRLLFEGARVCGVEWRDGAGLHSARATREVALCAGAVNSPQLLELSGIGEGARLTRLGIAVKKHLPGVGENLRNHLQARLALELRGLRTLNQFMPSAWEKARMGLRWLLLRDGLMMTPGVTAHAFAMTDPGGDRPDIKLQLHYLTSPDERDPKQLRLDPFPGCTISVAQLQPLSRGSVHVRSADPFAQPEIRTNYLSAEEDLLTYVKAMQVARRVARQPALARHVVREVRPGPAVGSDDAMAEYLRATIQPSYHPVGTCRMGSDPMAVVDARLRVHGVPGLRVADASIMPTIAAANTNAAAIMIGEKAADLIRAAAGS